MDEPESKTVKSLGSATWAFVTISPLLLITKPLPKPPEHTVYVFPAI